MRVGDLLEQRFRLDHQVGSGAMGIVFRARDLARHADVAVKVMRGPAGVNGGEEASRFAREAAILLSLQHPSVVRYVAHGWTPAREPFLAMEWLSGETLKERVERAPLALAETIDVGLALASALAGAHAQGVVHRDVKPANVFLVERATECVKLLDFGVARVRTGRVLTEAGTAIGTPAYMSPEQATGEGDVGAPSDVFSLGTVLFELVSGTRPFAAEEMLEMMMKLTLEPAPQLSLHAPTAPVEVTSLVDQMLSKAPSARPPMGQVFARLGAARRVVAPSAAAPRIAPISAHRTIVQPLSTPETARAASPKPSRWRWRAVALASVVALAVSGLIVFLLVLRPTNTSSPSAARAPTPRTEIPASVTPPSPSASVMAASSGLRLSLSQSGISFSLTFGPPTVPCAGQACPSGSASGEARGSSR